MPISYDFRLLTIYSSCEELKIDRETRMVTLKMSAQIAGQDLLVSNSITVVKIVWH